MKVRLNAFCLSLIDVCFVVTVRRRASNGIKRDYLYDFRERIPTFVTKRKETDGLCLHIDGYAGERVISVNV